MKADLFHDIIKKCLEGHATPHEKSMLSIWLREDPCREEIFYFYLSLRETENPQHLPDVVSKAVLYEKYLQGEVVPGLNCENPFREERATARKAQYAWWLAASVILFVSAGFYFFQDDVIYRTYSSENGNTRMVSLEDGSTVTLNANSSIKVYRDFLDHASREVWIKGEAFFEVTKKVDQVKFIVHTDNFDVEVLGTKFNINNRRRRSEVILAEGKVKLVAKDRAPLIMKPGEQVSLSTNQKDFHRAVVGPEKFEAWRNNKLVFENTSLAKVAEMIHDHYGVEMLITDPVLRKREFTGTLPNDDLEVILMALTTSYNIEIEQRGDKVLLNNRISN